MQLGECEWDFIEYYFDESAFLIDTNGENMNHTCPKVVCLQSYAKYCVAL